MSTPESTPTPVGGLSWSALQQDCVELAEALRARAQPGGVRFPTAAESWRLRELADSLTGLAAKWARLPAVSADGLETRRRHFESEYVELRHRAQLMLRR